MRLSSLTFIVVYLGFIVSAKKKYSDESDEFGRRYMDLTGVVRRQFGLEASITHFGSVISSPVAALLLLGQLTVGAEKKTEKELLNALGLKSSKQIKRSFVQLIQHLARLPGCTLDVVSRIFVSRENRVKLSKRFEKRMHDIFKTSVGWIKPSDPNRAKKYISRWIAKKMRHKIKEIESLELTTHTSLVLVSATFFSGRWKTRFDKPYKDSFYPIPGYSVEVQMMSKRARYHYTKSTVLKSKIIELPFVKKEASMILVLPDSTDEFEGILKTLKVAPDLLNDALAEMKYEEVFVTMPTFKIESELNLKPLFRKNGVYSIFNSANSNLNGIIENLNVTVIRALQISVIEVNEKGTDAASGGAIMMNQAIQAQVIPLEFKANHPFRFYVIAHQEQLFSGVFRGPQTH